MKYALNIGRPFGIKLSIHWTFLLIIAWVVLIDIQQGLNIQQILLSVLFILSLFVCVVLHEFGHALTARQYGAEVHSIVLLPIGGMANIRKMPEKPKQELIMTAAGLAVNVVIALILWIILSTTGKYYPEQMDFTRITTRNFFIMLMFVNLFVVAFNLIPAFPMDGGRLLRAALATKMNRLKATRWAKNTGQVFAALFVFGGLFINPFLVVIGIFVFIGAGAEYNIARIGQSLSAHKARDALITEFVTVKPDESLGEAARKLMHHHEGGFIVTRNNELEGVLTKNDIIKGLTGKGPDTPVKEVMSRNIEAVDPETSLQKVFRMIQERKYPLVPVVKEDRIEGVLDMDHLNKFVMIKNAMKDQE